ncbi:MAG: hypothetical protein ACRDKB_09720 [Actinomycetota bacterium]
MFDPDSRLMDLAKPRFGIVTRALARAVGLTDRMIDSRIKRGLLNPIHPGVFLLAGVPLSWEGSLVAAQMWLGEHAVVSHRSAARLWDVDGFKGHHIELTLASGMRMSDRGVIIHRSTQLPKSDVRTRNSLPVTTPERTLVDLGGVVSEGRLEEALDSALLKGLTTFERVVRRTRNLPRGTRGLGNLKRLLADRDPDQAPRESIFETRFYRMLCRSRLPNPVPQYRVYDADGLVGRIDLAYPRRMVGVEAYSLRWHGPRLRAKRDWARHNRLSILGWRMLYETYEDLNENPGDILARLEALLCAR